MTVEPGRRLLKARQETDSLFQLVPDGSLYERPIAERHRIVFYIGHLEAFDANLMRAQLGLDEVNPAFSKLFAFGIDPVGGGLPDDVPSDWPDLTTVRDYVAHSRHALDAAIAGAGDGVDSVLLNVALEHRLMHAETLAYMLHRLPASHKLHRAAAPAPKAPRPTPETLRIPAGEVTLGASDRSAFGWDNEFAGHRQKVAAFAIDKYMTSNGDYLRFLEAGGYQTRDFWAAEAWEWISGNGITHPAFWRQDNGRWLLRGMFDETPLPLSWPVYVSHAEASAYARWMGKQLPTEAEWHRAAYGTPNGEERAFPWGDEAPSSRHGNFAFERWDPAPVAAFAEGQSAFGVVGLLGNGWEWTSTPFQPFPGFEPFPFYPGYSANFFDGKHYVMKGGSARTDAAMLRRSFRNWFQPLYPFVYAGFRCVVR